MPFSPIPFFISWWQRTAECHTDCYMTKASKGIGKLNPPRSTLCNQTTKKPAKGWRENPPPVFVQNGRNTAGSSHSVPSSSRRTSSNSPSTWVQKLHLTNGFLGNPVFMIPENYPVASGDVRNILFGSNGRLTGAAIGFHPGGGARFLGT